MRNRLPGVCGGIGPRRNLDVFPILLLDGLAELVRFWGLQFRGKRPAKRSKFRRPFAALLLGSLACTSPASALPSVGQAEPFRDGDVVCFVGDSITHTGSYPSLIALFYATRFPERNITYKNAGFSGDRASAIMADEAFRLKTDILGRKATVATVMLGMNDVDRGSYGPGKTDEKSVAARVKALGVYQRAMVQLIERLQGSAARVILLTPSAYDDTAAKPIATARFMGSGRQNNVGVNAALGQCAEMMRGWAHGKPTGLVDFHAVMTAIAQGEQARDPDFTLISVDRIHPGVIGHFVMAYAFIKAQGLEGNVAMIAVDAASRATAGSRNCTITALEGNEDGLRFSVQEKSLPFPVPADARGALALVPFTDEFNREPLRVTGLKPGRYRLEIDDMLQGEFSGEDLARGIDVAENPRAPQVLQASEVEKLSADRMEAVMKQRDAAMHLYQASKAGVNTADSAALTAYAERKSADFATKQQTPDLRFQRFRESLANPGKFEREDAALTQKIYQACQPRMHRFVLTQL